MFYLLTGKKVKRMGHAHPSFVPYQAFQDKEGRWFIVAAANDRLWQALCKALGREDLANDPRFRTNPDRVANRDVLVKMLQEIFATNSREYWLKLLEKKYSVPAAVHPRAVVYGVLRLFSATLGFLTVSPGPLTALLERFSETWGHRLGL
jgi:crotonobetainyl-CoA:carnitine CoA-transferase CaiB-like acyl-CoA transferase